MSATKGGGATVNEGELGSGRCGELRGDAPVELKIEWEGEVALARFRLAERARVEAA